jgi:AcrR family transcriptional regulator
VKKGEIKKQEILQTAEAMFCRNGYDKTSVQDILDALHTSKGSFYHHYASKELLLEEICRTRVKNGTGQILSGISDSAAAADNINRLFSGAMPLNGENLTFLRMLLPVFILPEGMQIRAGYADALTEMMLLPTVKEIVHGNETGEFFCTDPQHSAEVCWLLIHDCWIRICMLIIRSEQAGEETDPSELLSITDHYRHSVERLLSAPFGSIRLMNLDELIRLTEQIHYYWNRQH